MSREKMTISWTRPTTRPANEDDVAENQAWHAKHPGSMSIPIKLGDEIDVEEDIELPGKYEVCDRCQGTGSHVNPSIDGHGITADEWNGPDWSEEDKETYLSGGYDVICHECKGKRVVVEIDEEACDKQLLEEYYEHQAQVSQWDYEDRMTRYYESGGYDGY